jgi:glycosyltransferase involved in cell wall biosynthesis
VTPWLLDGGIERVLENSVPWLAGRGFRCEVASWRVATHLAGAANPVLTALAEASVPVRLLKAHGRLQLVQRAVQTAALAWRGGHRLIVGYELEGNLVALLAKRLLLRRVRVMAQIHNASGIHQEVGTSPRLLGWARRLYPEADSIVAVSEDIRRDSARFFRLDPSRVQRLYNPLPISMIRRRATGGPGAGPWPTAPFIVGCGRLVRMKGFPDLVRAFAAIRATCSIQLVILGEGPERKELERLIREHGLQDEVMMPGFVANPWSYFARARAFVLSSLFGESFSMVLVEAMACGVPVIASRCEWGPEEILGGGRYGRLYDPGDVDGLTRHLRGVLEAPEEAASLTRAASERAEDFSQERVLPELERHLAKLVR